MHLVLHAVRLLGFADADAIARRFNQDDVEAALQDAEARGWATYSSFAGTSGWSLTEAGRAENELPCYKRCRPVSYFPGQVYSSFLT